MRFDRFEQHISRHLEGIQSLDFLGVQAKLATLLKLVDELHDSRILPMPFIEEILE